VIADAACDLVRQLAQAAGHTLSAGA